MRKMRRIRAKLAASPESVTARSALGHSPLSDVGDSLQDMWDMMGSLMVCVRVTMSMYVSGCVLVRARWWMDVDSNSARQYSSWPRQNRRPRVYAADADESKINAGWSFVASSSQAVVG